MVIVAGHVTVEPQQRESYLAGCASVVEQARGTAGCLDFAITADLIDPGRVNIFERWESQAPSKPSAAAAPATSRAPQCSRRRWPSTTSPACGHCSGKARHEPAARIGRRDPEE